MPQKELPQTGRLKEGPVGEDLVGPAAISLRPLTGPTIRAFTVLTDEIHVAATDPCPPIPVRDFDYRAWRGDYDEGSLQGWGKTPTEAVVDLLEREEGTK